LTRADRSSVPNFQSAETTTTEKALIRRVLLNICSVPLFRRVNMMFMLHQFLVPRYFPLTLSASLTAIGWGTGGIWLDITENPQLMIRMKFGWIWV
jgi:hypothetical protein